MLPCRFGSQNDPSSNPCSEKPAQKIGQTAAGLIFESSIDCTHKLNCLAKVSDLSQSSKTSWYSLNVHSETIRDTKLMIRGSSLAVSVRRYGMWNMIRGSLLGVIHDMRYDSENVLSLFLSISIRNFSQASSENNLYYFRKSDLLPSADNARRLFST
eukprot:sb/3473113/